MKKINRLSVLFDNGTTKRLVGTLACIRNVTRPLPIPMNSLKTVFPFRRFLFRLKKKSLFLNGTVWRRSWNFQRQSA